MERWRRWGCQRAAGRAEPAAGRPARGEVAEPTHPTRHPTARQRRRAARPPGRRAPLERARAQAAAIRRVLEHQARAARQQEARRPRVLEQQRERREGREEHDLWRPAGCKRGRVLRSRGARARNRRGGQGVRARRPRVGAPEARLRRQQRRAARAAITSATSSCRPQHEEHPPAAQTPCKSSRPPSWGLTPRRPPAIGRWRPPWTGRGSRRRVTAAGRWGTAAAAPASRRQSPAGRGGGAPHGCRGEAASRRPRRGRGTRAERGSAPDAWGWPGAAQDPELPAPSSCKHDFAPAGAARRGSCQVEKSHHRERRQVSDVFGRHRRQQPLIRWAAQPAVCGRVLRGPGARGSGASCVPRVRARARPGSCQERMQCFQAAAPGCPRGGRQRRAGGGAGCPGAQQVCAAHKRRGLTASDHSTAAEMVIVPPAMRVNAASSGVAAAPPLTSCSRSSGASSADAPNATDTPASALNAIGSAASAAADEDASASVLGAGAGAAGGGGAVVTGAGASGPASVAHGSVAHGGNVRAARRAGRWRAHAAWCGVREGVEDQWTVRASAWASSCDSAGAILKHQHQRSGERSAQRARTQHGWEHSST